jgi:hypothetical protein
MQISSTTSGNVGGRAFLDLLPSAWNARHYKHTRELRGRRPCIFLTLEIA